MNKKSAFQRKSTYFCSSEVSGSYSKSKISNFTDTPKEDKNEFPKHRSMLGRVFEHLLAGLFFECLPKKQRLAAASTHLGFRGSCPSHVDKLNFTEIL